MERDCLCGNRRFEFSLMLSTFDIQVLNIRYFSKRLLSKHIGMRDLRKSADKGTLKIIATNQTTLENVELEPQQLLFINKKNMSYMRDKILANQDPYILIYDDDYDIIEEMLYSVGNKAVNTIAIRTEDETSYYNNTFLIEKELIADAKNHTKFEYTLRDTRSVLN